MDINKYLEKKRIILQSYTETKMKNKTTQVMETKFYGPVRKRKIRIARTVSMCKANRSSKSTVHTLQNNKTLRFYSRRDRYYSDTCAKWAGLVAAIEVIKEVS